MWARRSGNADDVHLTENPFMVTVANDWDCSGNDEIGAGQWLTNQILRRRRQA
jgi:hypothetical protein